jgi:3-deoxy-D-manno-octulosonate 8-phosphate phosphatase KdsC-like HAD superfamily phosphatase
MLDGQNSHCSYIGKDIGDLGIVKRTGVEMYRSSAIKETNLFAEGPGENCVETSG